MGLNNKCGYLKLIPTVRLSVDYYILWQQQIVQYKQSWINVSELKEWSNSDIAHLFNITAIPFYLLINKEGTIMYNSFELHDFDCRQLEKYIQAELN